MKNTKTAEKKPCRSNSYEGNRVEGTFLTAIKLFARMRIPYGKDGKTTWHSMWWYKCDCGMVICKRRHCVGKGVSQTKSCGCYRRKKAKADAQRPEVAKNRFTSDQKTGNKRKIGAQVGHTAYNKGAVCIYRNPSQGNQSQRKYVSVGEFQDIVAGFKEVNWS